MGRRLPPLKSLPAFEAAARHLSFTRAAQELHVTQSAISQQVKALEQHLGVSLFHRLNQGLALTDEGRHYFPLVRDSLAKIRNGAGRLSPDFHEVPEAVDILSDTLSPGISAAVAKPVVAVLPFDNLSESDSWDRFATGLCDDIITDLSRHPDLLVIARNSSFAYKGKAVDVRHIGRDLVADYVLEGSVRAEGTRLRVLAQLVHADDGSHLWAERYDRETDDLFAVQDDLVEHVVAALSGFHGEILRAERDKLKRRPPANLRSYELYLLAYEQGAKYTEKNIRAAIDLCQRAIALDPLHARTWTVLGWAYEDLAIGGWAVDQQDAYARRRVAVVRASELDPRDPVALVELGAIRALGSDLSGAREAFERALELGHGSADALALAAMFFATVLGREDEATCVIERAFRLNPHAPDWYFMNLLRVAYFAGDFEKAVDAAKRSADFQTTHLFNLLSLAQLGRKARAAEALAEFRRRYPDFDPESVVRDFPLIHPPAIELYRDGVRKTGL